MLTEMKLDMEKKLALAFGIIKERELLPIELVLDLSIALDKLYLWSVLGEGVFEKTMYGTKVKGMDINYAKDESYPYIRH
jgi:hypothetical protein